MEPHTTFAPITTDDNERFRMAMEAAKIGTFDWNIATGDIFWSPNLKAFMGLPPGDYPMRIERLSEFIHRDDSERVQTAIAHSIETGEDYEIEFRMIRRDGTMRWVQARGKVHFDATGRAVRMLGIDIDATERKLFEERLIAAEQRYSDFYDHAPDLLFSIDATTGTVLECNQTACNVLGYAKCELIGRNVVDLYHPDSQAARAQAFKEFQVTGTVRNAELKLRRNDGGVLEISLNASAVRENGTIIRSRSICRDITELKRTQRALQISEKEARERAEELAAILDAVPAATFIAYDPECRTMTSSRSAYELLRLPYGSNTSKSAPEGQRPSNFQIVKDGHVLTTHELPVQTAAATGKDVRNSELSVVFEDGSSRDIFGHAVPLTDANGKIRGAVGAFIDITERNKMEQLRLQEELQRQLLDREIMACEAERRRIARELHDQAGQTMASLLAGLRLIQDSKKLPEVRRLARGLCEQVASGIDELERLSRGLHPLALDDFGLEAALRHHLRDYSDFHQIDVRFDVQGLDAGRLPRPLELALYRIVQELLTNTAKYAKARCVSVAIEATSAQLLLEVADDGIGFDTQNLPKRTGAEQLGLRGVQERIGMLGGNFSVVSSKGKGTIVKANIPLD